MTYPILPYPINIVINNNRHVNDMKHDISYTVLSHHTVILKHLRQVGQICCHFWMIGSKQLCQIKGTRGGGSRRHDHLMLLTADICWLGMAHNLFVVVG